MKLLSLTRLVRKLAVTTLAFWLAGAGCLLGCDGMASAASAKPASRSSQGSTLIVEGDACASTQGHSCCKKTSRAAKRVLAAAAPQAYTRAENDSTVRTLNESSTSSGLNACPFAISRALSVAKLGDSQMSGTAGLSPVLPEQAVREQKLVLSTISALPNRGHTYLHCCSFLI